MNVFILDYDAETCARFHNNKHVVKMILESVQLLNNALIANDTSYIPVYKQTHKNHPLSLWASKSRSNFDWLANLAIELCKEYTHRYDKTHKCEPIIRSLQVSPSRFKMTDIGMTTFLRCMPEEYKVEDIVESYRNYYRGAKRDIAKWSKRPEPEWWSK